MFNQNTRATNGAKGRKLGRKPPLGLYLKASYQDGLPRGWSFSGGDAESARARKGSA